MRHLDDEEHLPFRALASLPKTSFLNFCQFSKKKKACLIKKNMYKPWQSRCAYPYSPCAPLGPCGRPCPCPCPCPTGQTGSCPTGQTGPAVPNITVGTPNCPGAIVLYGSESIQQSGSGASQQPASLVVGAPGASLPASAVVYGDLAVSPGPTGTSGSLVVDGDITATTGNFLGGGGAPTLSVGGTLVVTPEPVPSLSAASLCSCPSCQAAFMAAAPGASLLVGSATDAAPASVELWGNTVVAFPTSYTGGTGAAPLLTVLGDAIFTGSITAAGGFTGGSTGGLAISTLIVGSPTGPTGSTQLYGTTLISSGTGAGQVQVLPTSARLSGPVVGVSGTSIAVLECVQPDGSDQNAILAAPAGISIACTAPAANFSVSAPSASIGTPLGESTLDLTTGGASLLSTAGTVTLNANNINVQGLNTGGNGITLTAQSQQVNAENWTLNNATGDYNAQMLAGTQWRIQAGAPTSLLMRPSGSSWTSPGIDMSAQNQVVIDVPRTPPTGGFTGGYTSNQLYARNDNNGWNFQSREQWNAYIDDGNNTSNIQVNAGGINLTATGTGSSANFSIGNNQARFRMDNGGNYIAHFNATGGQNASLSVNGNGPTLQANAPGSNIRLTTFNPTGGNSAQLSMETTTGNIFLSGGPGGNLYLGFSGSTGSTSSYTVLPNNQPRADPQEGLIQFGTDNNLYFYKGGVWQQVTATGATPP